MRAEPVEGQGRSTSSRRVASFDKLRTRSTPTLAVKRRARQSMTLYRATVMDTPRNPFVEADALTRRIRRGDRGPRRRDHRARPVRRADHRQLIKKRSSIFGAACCCRGWSTPTCTTRRSGRSPGWACRCWTGWRSARCPRRRGSPRTRTPRSSPGSSSPRWSSAGTTTALVFGAHFASAMDVLFEAADRSGLRITAGQVVSDRILRPELLTRPAIALSEGRALIERWHGRGRLRYAVTPRFSLSATEAMLDSCAELMQAADGLWFTSHINENLAEVAEVRRAVPGSRVLPGQLRPARAGHRAQRLRPQRACDRCRTRPAGVDRAPGRRTARPATPPWAAGCSRCGGTSSVGPGWRWAPMSARGTGFSMLKEGLQAYFMQQLLGADGLPLTPAHLLYLCTRAGAQALGLDDRVGDLRVGKEFDAVWLKPREGSTLATVLDHASDANDALAKIFALGNPGDVAKVWVAGDRVR